MYHTAAKRGQTPSSQFAGGGLSGRSSLFYDGLAVTRLEAVAAVNRLLVVGLERDHGVAAALGADGRVHFTLGITSRRAAAIAHRLFGGAAGRATLRLIFETLLAEESLLLFGEHEGRSAILAHNRFIH